MNRKLWSIEEKISTRHGALVALKSFMNTLAILAARAVGT